MFVHVNGAILFFDVEGAGLVPDGHGIRAKPTLILPHGGPGFDNSSYKPAFSTWPTSHRLYASIITTTVVVMGTTPGFGTWPNGATT
jgi:hypothetical protein